MQELPHAKIVDGRAKKHRRQPPSQKLIEVKRIGRRTQELDLRAQVSDFIGKTLIEQRIIEAGNELELLFAGFETGRKDQHLVFEQVVHAAKTLAHAHRPGDWGASNAEHRFDLIHELRGVAALPVEFVHEGDDGGVAQAADLE